MGGGFCSFRYIKKAAYAFCIDCFFGMADSNQSDLSEHLAGTVTISETEEGISSNYFMLAHPRRRLQKVQGRKDHTSALSNPLYLGCVFLHVGYGSIGISLNPCILTSKRNGRQGKWKRTGSHFL